MKKAKECGLSRKKKPGTGPGEPFAETKMRSRKTGDGWREGTVLKDPLLSTIHLKEGRKRGGGNEPPQR